MRSLKAVMADIEEKAKSAQALYAKGEEATAEDVESLKTYKAELETLEAEKALVETFEADRVANEQRLSDLANVQSFSVPTETRREYATAAPHTTSFTGNGAGEKAESAFRFGQWFKAAVGKDDSAKRWCMEHNLREFTISNDSATAGAAVIPTEFKPAMQVLLERYSALRQLCTPWKMTGDTLQVPRTTAGLTVYSPGQGAAVTASDPTIDMVTLKADTFLTLTYIALETLADSPIAMGNYVFDLIAQAFGAAEDDMLINGDGTSTYWGRVGLATAFRQMDPSWNSTTLTNVANIAGAYVQSNKAYASQVIADLAGVSGLLPQYADNPNTKWLCSRSYKTHVMDRLAYAAGGVTVAQLNDAVSPKFMGFPIVISQKAPRAPAGAIDAAAGGIPVFLGDFTKGVAFGDRQEYTLATSEHVGFASNTLAIRGSMRIDIVCHGVGNYTATAASRQPGPIVCGIGPHT